MAESITQEALIITGMAGATAGTRFVGATTSGAPTTGTFAVGDYVVDQTGSTWICTASSQTASATTASGNVNFITFTASNSFSPGQYVNITGFSNAGYNVSNAVIGSATSTQFTVTSSATGSTTGTGTAITTGTWTRQLPSTTQVAGKNAIINGDFGVWQRGTTFSPSVGAALYVADRFYFQNDNALSATISQQTFTPGTAPVSGYEGTYFLRWAMPGTTTTYPALSQRIEDVRKFAGQTITVSFWAKASSSVAGYAVINQNFGSGGSATVQTGYPAFLITTSWQRISYTLNMPSISGKTIGTGSYIEAQFCYFNPGTVMPSTVDIWGVQVEAGPTATQFSTATGTVQGELAACQRYYYQTSANASNTPIGSGWSTSSTVFTFNWQLPVPLRVAPSSIGSNSTSSGYYIYQGGAFINCNSISGILSSASYTNMVLYVTTSGLTTGYGGMFFANNSSAYLYASAEL